MSVSIAPYPRFKAFYPATGNPLSGGFLYTVQPGTTIQYGFPPAYPQPTYTDSTEEHRTTILWCSTQTARRTCGFPVTRSSSSSMDQAISSGRRTMSHRARR